MHKGIIESYYPISFREEDARALGRDIKNRRSVVLLGMRRVGISNFLRFFLYHKDIAKTYIDHRNHLFIPVDLNDLVEREVFPFWTLTLKRIVDRINESDFHQKIKDSAEELFLSSIQSGDLFLTIDGVRRAMRLLVDEGVVPTIFFLRFDRIKEKASPELFANLEGIQEAAHQRLSYVFTAFRNLDVLCPHVFTKAELSAFAETRFIKPATPKDTEIIFTTYKSKYRMQVPTKMREALFNNTDGYVQYVQLALILLHEKQKHIESSEEMFKLLTEDERIMLQSEELWESLDEEEKEVLLKIISGVHIEPAEKKRGQYLWDTGFVTGERDFSIFSPLFSQYVLSRKKGSDTEGEFTKKELELFNYLKENKDQICEREKIIEAVWPEEEALGVSDWAIDRLVARVRSKLKLQKNEYEILTVKTRGYKLQKR